MIEREHGDLVMVEAIPNPDANRHSPSIEEMIANEGNFECQSYSITSSNYDALFSFSNF